MMKTKILFLAWCCAITAIAQAPLFGPAIASRELRAALLETNKANFLTALGAASTNMPAARIGTLTVGDATGLGGTPIDVQWFGAIPDDGTNDYTNLNTAKAAAISARRPLYLRKGKYELSGSQYLELTGDIEIVGDGPDTELSHGGLGSTTSMFTLSGARRVTLRNLLLSNARYVIPITTGYSEIESIVLDNVTVSNCWFGVHANLTDGIYTNKNFLNNLTLNRVRHHGIQMNGAGHLVYLSGVPYKNILVNNCYITGGSYGITVEMDNTHSNQNWVPYIGQIGVYNSTFSGLDNQSAADTVALKWMARNAIVMGNRFENIANTTASGERTALYAYGGHARVMFNTFYNIGGTAASGAETMIFKGSAITVDPADGTTETVSLYNHVSGWRAMIHGNIFQGIKETGNRTGYILFDTDGFEVTRNAWIDCTNISAAVNFGPSLTSFNETGLIVVEDNVVVRGGIPLLAINTTTNVVNGVRFNRNLYYKSTNSAAIYAATFNNSVKNVEMIGNHMHKSTGIGLLKLGASILETRDWSYDNFRIHGNTLEDTKGASGGYLLLAGAAGNTNRLTNFSLQDNVIDGGEPTYFASGTNLISNFRSINQRIRNSTYNYEWRVGTGTYGVTNLAYSSNHIMYVNTNANTFTMQPLYAPYTP